MSIKLGVVMDPIESIKPYKDSTLAMLLAAQQRGWDLVYMEMPDLFKVNDVASARMCPLKVFDDHQHWFEKGEPFTAPLSSLDVILMRKDPPFDIAYIYTTYLLEDAERNGTLIVNKPQSLRDCNEKLYATHFVQCIPKTLVSSSADQIRDFVSEVGDAVVKPLDAMGGSSIFRLKTGDPNIGVIIETVTNFGKTLIEAQQFIPDIDKGDKRILLIDGEPVPYALARIPAKGEFRGNLAAGGSGVGQPLSADDRWICDQIKDDLKARGLLFVGIDVIGKYLTEINVTSPTCIRELDQQFGLDIAGDLMNAIELKLKSSLTV